MARPKPSEPRVMLNLWMPTEVHARLRAYAGSIDVSMTKAAADLLDAALPAQKPDRAHAAE